MAPFKVERKLKLAREKNKIEKNRLYSSVFINIRRFCDDRNLDSNLEVT